MDIHTFAVTPLTSIHHNHPKDLSLLIGSHGSAWMTGPTLGRGDLALGKDQLKSGCGFLGFIILLVPKMHLTLGIKPNGRIAGGHGAANFSPGARQAMDVDRLARIPVAILFALVIRETVPWVSVHESEDRWTCSELSGVCQ